jgi:hypothetical protein
MRGDRSLTLIKGILPSSINRRNCRSDTDKRFAASLNVNKTVESLSFSSVCTCLLLHSLVFIGLVGGIFVDLFTLKQRSSALKYL